MRSHGYHRVMFYISPKMCYIFPIDCCNAVQGSEGCQDIYECCRNQKLANAIPCIKQYQCCHKNEGTNGCKFACCRNDVTSKGCKQRCQSCKADWGVTPGCINTTQSQTYNHDIIDITYQK